METNSLKRSYQLPTNLYGLTLEEYFLDMIDAIAELYFSDDEYMKVKAQARKLQSYDNSQEREANEIHFTYWKLNRQIRARYYYAVEIALAIKDSIFLLETPIEPLAKFVLKREEEIFALLTEYYERKGESSLYHYPNRFETKIIFIDPEEPPFPKGRALSLIEPRSGEKPLQEYPPFVKIVESFIRTTADKERRPHFVNEMEITRRKLHGLPMQLGDIMTHHGAQVIEEAFKQAITGRKSDKIKVSLEKYSYIINSDTFQYEKAFDVNERRVINGLYHFAMDAPGRRYENEYINFSFYIDDLVKVAYPCKGKSKDTIDRYKSKLYDTINIIAQREFMEIERLNPNNIDFRHSYITIIKDRKFETKTGKKTKGLANLSLYYGKYRSQIAIFLPHNVGDIENDATFSLYLYLYKVRNERKEWGGGKYYPLQVSYKVRELIRESLLEGTDKVNNRKAKIELGKKLEYLAKGKYIINYFPEKIPLDDESEVKITFLKDGESVNSVSKYSLKAKELKARNE